MLECLLVGRLELINIEGFDINEFSNNRIIAQIRMYTRG